MLSYQSLDLFGRLNRVFKSNQNKGFNYLCILPEAILAYILDFVHEPQILDVPVLREAWKTTHREPHACFKFRSKFLWKSQTHVRKRYKIMPSETLSFIEKKKSL